VITGTIFSSGSIGGKFIESGGLLAGVNVDVPTSVAASGKIATIVFDTTALTTTGPFTLGFIFPSTPLEETEFRQSGDVVVPYSPTQLTLNVVPEPSAFLLVGLIGSGSFVAVRIARRVRGGDDAATPVTE
jgi:hypothetical protein